MVAIEVVGWFVSPLFEKFINTCSDYLKEQAEWQTDMTKELESLRENLEKIKAFDIDAIQAQISDQKQGLKEWIWRLRRTLDEVNDVLDEFEYMKLKEQLTETMEETDQESTALSIASFLQIESASKIERAFKIDDDLKQRLEQVVQKLDNVLDGVSPFLNLLESAKQEQQEKQRELFKARETGSLRRNVLIGRGEAKDKVMQWLTRKPSNEHRETDLYRNISLLSIVGHGGMGKTTLMQHVYEDEITKEFDLKMWVCVSNNFDVKKVIADMLECLKNERPRLETLVALQRRLKEEVMSKKFLLVLDDIWEEEEWDKSKWGNVLAPLASGGLGSKILITTRTDSVALMFEKVIKKKKEIVKLDELEKDECLQLLNSHAFAGAENLSDDDHKKLSDIAGDIVKKLLGCPLAAKVIGDILHDNLDERHWKTLLESNLLGENSIKSILKLSYIFLPNHLQNCFAFCCMFPQGHTFDKDDLVQMWISLGFIQPSHGMTMEDIGGRYFDALVNKTLVEEVRGHYKMHDLIHESASNFFAQVCGKFVGDEMPSVEFSETTRYLFVETANSDIIQMIGQFKHLHSLFLFYKAYDEDIQSALREISGALKSLRLLCVCAPDLKMIPDEEIGKLIHLRYFKIVGYTLSMMPRSLSNLYHLQYIIYDRPGELEHQHKDGYFLPNDINSLPNLQYVKLPESYSSWIRWKGRLKSCPEQVVGDIFFQGMKNRNDLFMLEINGLKDVKYAMEARNAQLCEKTGLTDLTLLWGIANSRNNVLAENVLDNLQPPKCLRNLRINGYMGARSAIWMNNVNQMVNLEKIELEFCFECETLPPFGKLPSLKSLKLFSMPKVKWLESKFNGNYKYCAFPLLEELHIYRCAALEDWFEAGVDAEDGSLFPCLIELKLVSCRKLKELPSLPSKLKSLEMRSTGWKTLNFCSNSNPIPLESLWVDRCPNITSLPLADEIARLAALRSLTIEKCPNLTSLGEMQTTNNCHLMLSNLTISDSSVLLMEPLRSIASLKELKIEGDYEVVSFPDEAEQWFLKVSSSLSELKFMHLASLQSLPSSLESLSSLQKLFIYDVPMLRELPNLPPSLKSLFIWGCHPDLEERYREDGGPDGHMIAHIPDIEISTN